MKRIGVVTAGGDAPGMNAAIRAIVRTSIFNGLEVVGIERGYVGLIERKIHSLDIRSVSGIINRGGTILKTARCEEIKTIQGIQKAVQTLKDYEIDALVVIGGDGSFRGARELHQTCGVPVIGVPATIDNDVFGTDTTIGARPDELRLICRLVKSVSVVEETSKSFLDKVEETESCAKKSLLLR